MVGGRCNDLMGGGWLEGGCGNNVGGLGNEVDERLVGWLGW